MFDLSIILATKNEEKNLKNFFSFLGNDDKKKYEILIIDNNSDDNTKQIASNFIKPENIISLNESEFNLNPRGKQINLGVEMCKSENIFFPDADMIFKVDLLDEAIEKLKIYDALYVPELIMNKSFFGKVRNFERSFYNCTVLDAFRFVKKDIFLQAGGFDHKTIKFGPDDWDFTLRVKQITNKINITEKSLIHNETEMNLKKYLIKKSKYVNCFNEYREKWDGNILVKKQFSLFYRFIMVFFENKKWKKVFLNPVNYISVIFVKIILGFVFVFKKK